MTADAAGSNFNIREASVNLPRIIERVEHGEEIVISRAGTPVAKVIPLRRPKVHRTGYGSLAAYAPADDEWNSAAVNDEIANEFG